MTSKPLSLKIYLDVTGDTIILKKRFQPNMLTGKQESSNKKPSKYVSDYLSRLYFTDSIPYTVELFKKYNINDAVRAVNIFSDEIKSKRLFDQIEKIKKIAESKKKKSETSSKKQAHISASDEKPIDLNDVAKQIWGEKLSKVRVNSTNNIITKEELEQLREATKTEFETKIKAEGYALTKKQKEGALKYAEQQTTDSKPCTPHCETQNISFLLDLLFRKRQSIFLNGKKYYIAKYTDRDENSKGKKSRTTVFTKIVTLRVLDSEKKQSMLAYYDCGGKKQQLQTQLTAMFPTVFDFFDINKAEKSTSSISQLEEKQLLTEYRTKKREYNDIKRALNKIKYSPYPSSNADSDELNDTKRLNDAKRLDDKLDNIQEELNILEKHMSKQNIKFHKRYRPRDYDRYHDNMHDFENMYDFDNMDDFDNMGEFGYIDNGSRRRRSWYRGGTRKVYRKKYSNKKRATRHKKVFKTRRTTRKKNS